MKKINISTLKPFPYIGQPLILMWEEKISGEKYTKTRSGYKLISLHYEKEVLIAEIYSPLSDRLVKTTYLHLCKNYTWHGSTRQPKAYEVQ